LLCCIQNYNVNAADSLSAYADKSSDWVLAGVNRAMGKGLIIGDGSSLDLKGTATGAQMAAIMQRFKENIAE
jgi:hypothetical protein